MTYSYLVQARHLLSHDHMHSAQPSAPSQQYEGVLHLYQCMHISYASRGSHRSVDSYPFRLIATGNKYRRSNLLVAPSLSFHTMTQTLDTVKSTHNTQKGDEAPSTIPPILRLPPELFDTLLHHVNPEDLQSTALALSRVFPDHPISRTHLWRHVVARNKAQMIPMWKKMKAMQGKGREGGPDATRTFSMVCHPVLSVSRHG